MSRNLKRFIEEAGPTPNCVGCKACKWTPEQLHPSHGRAHSWTCQKRRASWQEESEPAAQKLRASEKAEEPRKLPDLGHGAQATLPQAENRAERPQRLRKEQLLQQDSQPQPEEEKVQDADKDHEEYL